MNGTTESTMSGVPNLFGWVDFSMFGMMLALSAFIGVYFGFCSKQDTKVEYLLGGKSMSIWPVAVSLVASYISGVTLMGVPSEIYMFGTLYVLMCFANIIVALLMDYIYLPVFFELQLTSTYEYLELRFNKKVRIMSSVLFTMYVVLFIPVVVYVPALAFSQVSGYSVHLITPIVCIICIFYTMLGGIKAVVWTDFLQSFIMLGACIVVIVLGVLKAGGLYTVFQRSNDGGRLIIFEMDPSLTARNTFWTVLIGTTVMWMGLSVNQGALQKYLSLPSIRSARKALIIYCIGLIMMKGMSIFTGLIVYATYYDCDPIQTQAVKRVDQLLPYFVMDTVGNIPGLPGLFIAGIFSAALSTLSSCLNCLSATVFEDFVQPLIKAKDGDRKANYIMKGIVVVVGGLCLVLVLIVEKLGGVLELGYSTQGVTLGTLLGLFTLGVLFPWANAKGALWGSIVSLTLVSWIVFGAQKAIATGKLTHKKLPTSIEGCDFNITSFITTTTTMSKNMELDDIVNGPLFGWIDYLLFCLMLSSSAMIGIYFGFCGKKEDTPKEYLHGGKTMRTFPVAVSLVTSSISGITMLGLATEVYIHGTLLWLDCFSAMIAGLLITYFYLPVFYELQSISSYEYLDLRFNRSVRIMTSALYTLYLILYMPIVVYVPALVLSQVSGLNVHFITPLTSVVCIIYTLVGGMKAVVWTDFLQGMVMLLASVTVIILGVSHVGGFSTIWQRNWEGGRIRIFEMSPSPLERMSFWSVIFCNIPFWLYLSTNQAMIQKYMSVPTLSKARRSLYIYIFGIILVYCISCFTGLLIYAEYQGCDPVQSKKISKPDELLTYYVTRIATSAPGLSGLFVSGICSAALSTLSSTLNSLGATVFEDFIRPFLKRAISDQMANNIIKLVVFVIGVTCILMAFVVEKMGLILQLCLSITGVTGGATVGLFSFGMFYPRGNAKGALAGGIVSLILMGWIVFGTQKVMAEGKYNHPTLPITAEECGFNSTEQMFEKSTGSEEDDVFVLYKISFLYYNLIGMVTVFVVGILVSHLTEPPQPNQMDPMLFTPIVRKFMKRKDARYKVCNTTESEQINSETVKKENL